MIKTIKVVIITRYAEQTKGLVCNNCKLAGICWKVDPSEKMKCSRFPQLYVTNLTVLDIKNGYTQNNGYSSVCRRAEG